MYVVLLIYGLAVAVDCRPTASVSRRLAVSSSDASIDASGCCRYINCLAVLVLIVYASHPYIAIDQTKVCKSLHFNCVFKERFFHRLVNDLAAALAIPAAP